MHDVLMHTKALGLRIVDLSVQDDTQGRLANQSGG